MYNRVVLEIFIRVIEDVKGEPDAVYNFYFHVQIMNYY